jgi:uncharacterized protein YdhG (YjbR/CyaY superfamily)
LLGDVVVSPAFKTVDDYMASVSPEMLAALTQLREAIKAAAPEAEEVISYQIPTYKHRGPLCAFGAAKNHAGFYVMSKSVIEAFKEDLKPYSKAPTTIRFRLDQPIPGALVGKLVKARIAENEAARAK